MMVVVLVHLPVDDMLQLMMLVLVGGMMLILVLVGVRHAGGRCVVYFVCVVGVLCMEGVRLPMVAMCMHLDRNRA
jgi:hypothetical protein